MMAAGTGRGRWLQSLTQRELAELMEAEASCRPPGAAARAEASVATVQPAGRLIHVAHADVDGIDAIATAVWSRGV
eukprot:SAG25_NODE_1667_length_2576_cov_2.454178_2_plen_76_part_00